MIQTNNSAKNFSDLSFFIVSAITFCANPCLYITEIVYLCALVSWLILCNFWKGLQRYCGNWSRCTRGQELCALSKLRYNQAVLPNESRGQVFDSSCNK